MFEPFIKRKEWFEVRLKSWMKGKENSVKTFEVKGGRWKVILVKGIRRDIDRERMEKVLGKKFLRPFVKEIPVVRLKWEKLKDRVVRRGKGFKEAGEGTLKLQKARVTIIKVGYTNHFSES